MATGTQTTSRIQDDVREETSKFVLVAGITMTALIGVWGGVSLISALISQGPLNVVKGFFAAIVG